MGENRRVRWQPHERKWLKLLGTAALTFLISSFLCLFLVRTSRHDPLVVLCLFVLVPLTPPPAMLILGFYEQRLLRHVAGCVLSAVTGLAPFLYVLWEDADLGWEELTVVAGIYVPIMWFTGFIGSAIGIDVSRIFYTIITHKPGTCPGCSYPIRGLPERICPECGREFTLDEVGLSEAEWQKAPKASS